MCNICIQFGRSERKWRWASERGDSIELNIHLWMQTHSSYKIVDVYNCMYAFNIMTKIDVDIHRTGGTIRQTKHFNPHSVAVEDYNSFSFFRRCCNMAHELSLLSPRYPSLSIYIPLYLFFPFLCVFRLVRRVSCSIQYVHVHPISKAWARLEKEEKKATTM